MIMKKNFILISLYCLLLSGCRLIPGDLQLIAETPLIEIPDEGDLAPTPSLISPTIPVSTATLTIIPTQTQTPTQTTTPTKTLPPTKTATPTRTATPTKTSNPMPFQTQSESPVYIENFAHPEAACNWMGVAGQVFGTKGDPILNLVITVKGELNQTNVDFVGVTGIPQADIYGPGGYEVVLADIPLPSDQNLTIQVFDLAGQPLSEAVPFSTYADCTKNLIIINFQTK